MNRDFRNWEKKPKKEHNYNNVELKVKALSRRVEPRKALCNNKRYNLGKNIKSINLFI